MKYNVYVIKYRKDDNTCGYGVTFTDVLVKNKGNTIPIISKLRKGESNITYASRDDYIDNYIVGEYTPNDDVGKLITYTTPIGETIIGVCIYSCGKRCSFIEYIDNTTGRVIVNSVLRERCKVFSNTELPW